MGEVRAAVGLAVLPVSGRGNRAMVRTEELTEKIKQALAAGVDPHDREAIQRAIADKDGD